MYEKRYKEFVIDKNKDLSPIINKWIYKNLANKPHAEYEHETFSYQLGTPVISKGKLYVFLAYWNGDEQQIEMEHCFEKAGKHASW